MSAWTRSGVAALFRIRVRPFWPRSVIHQLADRLVIDDHRLIIDVDPIALEDDEAILLSTRIRRSLPAG